MTRINRWFDDFDEATKDAYQWFGHFISFYASVEGQCHVLFRRYAGVPEPVARAISGGMRLADLLPILSVVIEKSNMATERKQDFTDCLEQLKHLTALRHRLVHRGFEQIPGVISDGMGEFSSTNVLTAKARESIEILRFKLDDIQAAAKDSLRIYTRMQFITIDVPTDKFRRMLSKEFEEAVYGPWSYKPVQPSKPNQEHRNTRQ